MSKNERHQSVSERGGGRMMRKLSKGAPGKNSRIKNVPPENLKRKGHAKMHDIHKRFRRRKAVFVKRRR